MSNPTIQELNNDENFELIAELDHSQIKSFVINQLSKGGWMVRLFTIYQVLMLALLIFIIAQCIILAFNGNPQPLYFCLAALLFCLSILIVLHELLHGLAIKLTGAKKVNYGAYLKKFIFYAEADQYVLNKKQFAFIALTPLFVVKILTLIGAIWFYPHPEFYFFVFVMCAHSFFCAGDIGLLSIFSNYGKETIYTYDVKAEKKSYYFKKLSSN